jgi:hypothetical protein
MLLIKSVIMKIMKVSNNLLISKLITEVENIIKIYGYHPT